MRVDLADQRRLAQLDGGGRLAVPFTATFSNDIQTLRLEIVVDVANGRPVCRSYRVETFDDGGDLAMMTSEVLRGVKLRNLMSHACAQAAFEAVDDGGFVPAENVQAIEAVLGPLRRTRRPATDELLGQVADRYRAEFVPGRMVEFAEAFGYSERQMRRLIALARERELLEPSDRKRSNR